jgi:signal peptidase I
VITLAIVLVLIMAGILLNAWAVAWIARRVGSRRGRLRYGLLAAVLVLVVNLAFMILSMRSSQPANVTQLWAREGILLLIQLCIVVAVLSRTFALSTGRAFAPLAALFLVGIAQVAIALLILRPFVIQAFVIPTTSMSPTIDPSDRMVANKLLRPRRWDLVVYRSPPDQEIYCKRLIALPTERLRFDGGSIFINDQPAEVPRVLAGRCRAAPQGPDGRASRFGRYKEGETIALGPDEYFFVGDNIDQSADSRIYGPSAGSSIVGVIDLVYWPPRKIRIVR